MLIPVRDTVRVKVRVWCTFCVYYVSTKPAAFSSSRALLSRYRRWLNKVSNLKTYRWFCSHCLVTWLLRLCRITGRSGPENNLWFSINSPGRAVCCHHRAGRAAKVLARAISTSHKTWQTSLFFKPLQMQNIKRKKWGDMAYQAMFPRLKNWGNTSPASPTKLCPCLARVSSHWLWFESSHSVKNVSRVTIVLKVIRFESESPNLVTRVDWSHWNVSRYHCTPEVGPDPGCRSRIRQDSAFFFRTRIRSRSQNFVKNRTQIRSQFSISAVAGVCAVISYIKTWINYDWFDGCSRNLNRSRILKFKKLLDLDPGPDSKFLEQERSCRYDHYLVCRLDIQQDNEFATG